jgi:hypothetical protein
MPTKTTLRFNFMPVRKAITKKQTQQMLAKMQTKGNLVHCWLEFKSVWTVWKSIWRFLKVLKPELPCDLAVF